MKHLAITLFALGASAASAQAQYQTQVPLPVSSPSSGSWLGSAPCTQLDDGVTENSLGLTAGGWMCHMQYVSCLAVATEMSSAYGSAMFPGNITNGSSVKVAVWTDASPDENPTTNLTLVHTMDTSVTNGSTDILNPYPLPNLIVNSSYWIGAATKHGTGEFPGPMDVDNPTPRSWVFGSTFLPIDLVNINNNNVAPMSMNALGFPAAWLLRADGSDSAPTPGFAYCFCDPTSPFPTGVCGNPGAAGNGCANGANANGCNLAATGTTNPDTVVLHATGAVPSQPGLFFQGENATGGGMGLTFGDGLRCAGGNVIRLQTTTADANGDANTSVSISTMGGVTPGSGAVRRYQYWYRDPVSSPCGNAFNLSNGWEITW
jgi:hypothetical protein